MRGAMATGSPWMFRMEKLMPIVYDELRRVAHHYLRSERPDIPLQATFLVNGACPKRGTALSNAAGLAGWGLAWFVANPEVTRPKKPPKNTSASFAVHYCPLAHNGN
jgi:hypothetical protein